jgi:hypothetical protein
MTQIGTLDSDKLKRELQQVLATKLGDWLKKRESHFKDSRAMMGSKHMQQILDILSQSPTSLWPEDRIESQLRHRLKEINDPNLLDARLERQPCETCKGTTHEMDILSGKPLPGSHCPDCAEEIKTSNGMEIQSSGKSNRYHRRMVRSPMFSILSQGDGGLSCGCPECNSGRVLTTQSTPSQHIRHRYRHTSSTDDLELLSFWEQIEHKIREQQWARDKWDEEYNDGDEGVSEYTQKKLIQVSHDLSTLLGTKSQMTEKFSDAMGEDITELIKREFEFPEKLEATLDDLSTFGTRPGEEGRKAGPRDIKCPWCWEKMAVHLFKQAPFEGWKSDSPHNWKGGEKGGGIPTLGSWDGFHLTEKGLGRGAKGCPNDPEQRTGPQLVDLISQVNINREGDMREVYRLETNMERPIEELRDKVSTISAGEFEAANEMGMNKGQIRQMFGEFE